MKLSFVAQWLRFYEIIKILTYNFVSTHCERKIKSADSEKFSCFFPVQAEINAFRNRINESFCMGRKRIEV